MKRFFAAMAICNVLILSLFFQVFAQSPETTKLKVYINNQLYTFKSPIITKSNTLMLPIGELMTILDIPFDGIECRKSSIECFSDIYIDIVSDIGNISMSNESGHVWVSGDNLDMSVPPLIYNDTVYVPLEFASDVLKRKVIYDKKTNKAYISDVVLPEPKGWTKLKNRPAGDEQVKIVMDSTVSGIGSVGFKTNNNNKAVSINGRIYMIDNDGTLKEYNPISDKWTDKAKIAQLKDSKGNFKLAVLDGKILVIGVNCSDIFKYDIRTNKCEFLTSLPTERVAGSVIVAEGKVYILSGMEAGDPSTTNTFDMYDPITDTWTQKKDMFEGCSDLNSIYYNGKIYIFGGGRSTTDTDDLLEEDPITGEVKFKHNNENKFLGQNIEAYDIKTDTWSYITPDNLNWFVSGAEVCNGKLYLLGGQYIDGKTICCVKEYNPLSNKWVKVADMIYKKHIYAIATVNTEIFVIDGKKVEKFTPAVKNK